MRSCCHRWTEQRHCDSYFSAYEAGEGALKWARGPKCNALASPRRQRYLLNHLESATYGRIEALEHLRKGFKRFHFPSPDSVTVSSGQSADSLASAGWESKWTRPAASPRPNPPRRVFRQDNDLFVWHALPLTRPIAVGSPLECLLLVTSSVPQAPRQKRAAA